jgi:hypothetical protein
MLACINAIVEHVKIHSDVRILFTLGLLSPIPKV